jgi:hypothetical protein
MAVAKYGALITEIKGKIGGTIFQAGRGAAVVRAWNPSTKRVDQGGNSGDVSVRQLRQFATVTKGWQKLSQAQRDSWNDLIGVWTFIDKFGDTYNGTPYQIYCAAGLNRMIVGNLPLETAPVVNAAFDPGVSFSDYSLSGTFDRTNTEALAQGQEIFSQVSRPAYETQAFGRVQFAFSAAQNIPAPSTTNIKALYQSLYGGDPPLGSFLWIKIYTFWNDYPKAQFHQTFKVEVVA